MNNVLSPEDIEETLKEVWKDVWRMSIECVERDNPNTWEQNWPARGLGINVVFISIQKHTRPSTTSTTTYNNCTH